MLYKASKSIFTHIVNQKRPNRKDRNPICLNPKHKEYEKFNNVIKKPRVPENIYFWVY